MSKKIPERSEIAVENTWRLEDLYGSDKLWQADLVKFQQQIDDFQAQIDELDEQWLEAAEALGE